MPARFGGEEGLKRPPLGRGVHAHARVLHAELCPVAAVMLDPTRLKAQLAALGHGVLRVRGEVHHHLFDLGWVGHDPTRLRVDLDADVDIGPHQTPRELRALLNTGAEIHDHRLQDLPAREREQLLCQHLRVVR